MPFDQYFSNVSLLLHGNGSNGSTTITDSSLSPKTASVNGDVAISTAQSKFGGSSIAFDGSGDYIQYAPNAGFEMGYEDFTLEAWVRPSSLSSLGCIMTYANGSAQNGNYCFSLMRNGSAWYWQLFNGNTNYGPGAAGVATVNTWQHVAGVRHGTNMLLFVDGILVDTTAIGDIPLNRLTGPVLHIGQAQGFYPFAGHIDDARVTRGVARYVANFTPPTAQLPSFGFELSGVIKDSTDTGASRLVRAYDEASGYLVGEDTSDGSGNYSILAMGADPHTLAFYPAGGDAGLEAKILRGVVPIAL